ncbi:flavin monoamine oxidase family protein [Brassicibacter mesophilus]|uniref:flavin monoamine oxidase family protein n=1 Tax=Brassicibacter mesophilus TaxID=745119 RepID=UPI003D249D15
MFWDTYPPTVPAQPEIAPPQPDNPTDQERYALAMYGLIKANRPEDFYNIIRLSSLPEDITTIANPGEFKNENIKIGIIGAGVAGLSAAFELRKLGFDITMFEASEERIGGRIYTYHFDENNYGELGAMRIPVTHNATWHYVNLFNLNTRPFVQSNPNGLIYVRNTRVRNDVEGKNVTEEIYPKFPLAAWERKVPWMDLLNYAIDTPLLSTSPSIRTQLLQIRKFYDSLINFWDYYNVRQIMEMSGLSQGAIDMLTSISPFTRLFMYDGYIEVMMDNYQLSFLYLYEIIGGMSKLPHSFYNSLTSSEPSEYGDIPKERLGKVKINKGTWVEKISQPNNSKVTLWYKNKSMKTSIPEKFDYIICAIPFSTLRNVRIDPPFSTQKMQAIREVGYSLTQKTLFLCNKRFWQEGSPSERIIGGGSFTDLPISSIWYPSDRKPAYEPGVLLASYNFNIDTTRLGNLPDNLRYDDVKRQVELVHGLPAEYLNDVVKNRVYLNWNEYPWSLGGFCYFLPEQKRLFSYAIAAPEYNSRVLFAGEHVSVSHGWINGALQSSMAAANIIAKISKSKKIIY